MNQNITFILRLVVAGLFLQSLFLKFSAATISISVFSQLGIEPSGRLITGVAELLLVILILVPRTHILGAFLGFCLTTGALLVHLLVIGIIVKGDGGLMFSLKLITFVTCFLIMYLKKDKIKAGIQKSVSFLNI